jgi:hypothetical protein
MTHIKMPLYDISTLQEGMKVWWSDPEGLTSNYNTIAKIYKEEDEDIEVDTMLLLSEPNGSEVECEAYEVTPVTSLTEKEIKKINKLIAKRGV